MSPVSALLFVLLPCAVLSQRLKFAPEDMGKYNPLKYPKDCGLDKPGYICDPNRILGEHIHRVNWLLMDAADNGTKCPCSNYYCETAKGAKGYKIGILLVRKLKIQKKSSEGSALNSPEEQAQLVAYTIESDSNPNHSWKMGSCEEDIAVVYSVEDKAIAFYAGSTALVKLTPYYRNLLGYKISDHLQNGRYVEAMNNLIVDLKIVLNCDSDECDLHQTRGGSGTTHVSLAVLSLTALFTIYNNSWF